jgi:hypothetical protein
VHQNDLFFKKSYSHRVIASGQHPLRTLANPCVIASGGTPRGNPVFLTLIIQPYF